jgi:hypothetical protein
MINEDSIKTIRGQTRLALPKDDTYLYRLGIALYGFNSINSFMTEIICHIDNSQDRTKLLDMESGKVLDMFRKTLKNIKSEDRYSSIWTITEEVANLFENLNTERTDFVHAYPITNKDNEQILHRRKDSKKKYFEVGNNFLDDFIRRLNDVSVGLYKIRGIVNADI